MGSPETESGHRPDESPRTRVSLTRPFWLSQFEVTQGLWRTVMESTILYQAKLMLADDALYMLGGTERTIRDRLGFDKDIDPERAIGDIRDDLPMYWVNWVEAAEFCRRLNDHSAPPKGYVYRLPTEAEWEYACRAGTTGATYIGDLQILSERDAPALDAIAWYAGNSSVGFTGKGWPTDDWAGKQYPGGMAGPRAVGGKAPNRWGLYDMLGNVNEWCHDWYGALPGGSVSNPTGPASGNARVIRGGSWFNPAHSARAADRDWSKPGRRFWGLGFRVALAPRLDG